MVVVIPFLPKCAFLYTHFLLNLSTSDSTGSVSSPGPTGSACSASSAGSVGSPGSAKPGQPATPGSAESTSSAGSLPYPKDANLAGGVCSHLSFLRAVGPVWLPRAYPQCCATFVCRVVKLTCSRLNSQDSKLRGNGLRNSTLCVQRGHRSLNVRYAVASILLVRGVFWCGGGIFSIGFCGGVISHPRLRIYYYRAIWHSRILRRPR